MSSQMKSRPRSSSRLGGESGQAMVESALVFGLFLTMLIGMLEIGRAVWVYETLTQAVRAGARFAMMHGARNPAGGETTPTSYVEAMVESSAPGLDPDALTVAVTWTPDGEPGSSVEVVATYPVQLIAAPLFSDGNGSFSIVRSSTRRVLN